LPDPLREQGGFAVRRETARQRHAVADLYRRARLRACGTGKYQCGQHRQSGGARATQARTAFVGVTNHDLRFRIALAGFSKINIFQIMRLDPLANNGSSKTGCAVRIIPVPAYPMQIVRVRSSKTVAPTPLHEFPDHTLRPEPNVAAASAGMPLRSCSAARLLVDKPFRDRDTKSRACKQAEAGGGTQKGAMYAELCAVA
jgi:hypothetical protein